MTKTKLFTAAAVIASLAATPVLAQGTREASQNPAQIKKQQMKNPNLRQANNRDDWDYGADARYGRGYNDNGFSVADAAAGLVGGAVATAGAIATAPFGGPDYAYDDGYRYRNDGYNNAGYRGSYASVDNYPRVGAFATAPYTNPYEYNRVTPDNGWDNRTWSQRNEFVCVPGTVFTNQNGIRTLCQ